MIPQNKIEPINKALNSVFSTTEIDEISKITTGLSSSLVFKIIIKGKPYLLRVIIRTDAMADPTYNYSSMKAAADIGIAPKVYYTNIEERFSITEFIEAKPFTIEEARIKLPDVIRKLHTLSNFPKSPVMIAFGMADTYIKKFQSLNIMPESETKEIFEQYEQIYKVYPRDKEGLVTCHNDLKPENIVFDGDKPWLVDWESAFLNYKYADLSIVSNFVNDNEEDEKEFLKIYLGKEPSEYDLACFYLMQQVVHINYFTVFMFILTSTGKLTDFKNVPDFDYRDFHNKMWRGEITLDRNESRLHYALLHKKELEKNIQSERFKQSLDLVSKMK